MIKDVCFNDPGSPLLEEETSASTGHSAAISREYKTVEAAKRSRFLCFHKRSPIPSLSLRPPPSLNCSNPKRPYSIHSLQNTRRSYEYAIERFIAWYCSEPRLTFNRSVVVLRL